MNPWNKVGYYIALGISTFGLVEALIHIQTPLDGITLQMLAAPVVASVRSIWPEVKIPDALVADICNAVADALKTYKEKQTAVQA